MRTRSAPMKSGTMRRATIEVPFNLQIEEADIPAPGEREALIKVLACGICGTDIHDATHRARERRPFGHEAAGEVISLGPGVDRVRVGDRIALGNAAYCGGCNDCRNGDIIHCRNRIGLPAQGFSEYLAAHQALLHPARQLLVDLAGLFRGRALQALARRSAAHANGGERGAAKRVHAVRPFRRARATPRAPC